MTRVDRNRTLVFRDRVVEPASRLQNDGEIAVPVGLIRSQGQALLHQRDCFIASALLVSQQTGVVQRVRMMWRHLEYAAIELRRLGEVLLLLQLYGKRDGFIGRQLPRGRIRRCHH